MKVSKNFYRGNVIKKAEEIKKLALEKKSIYHASWGVKPAGFYMFLQPSTILDLIERKSIHKIIKDKK